MLSNEKKATTFAITDTKLFIPIVTLLTQDNGKMLEELKCVFKRTINGNKYQLKVSTEKTKSIFRFLN